MLNNILPIFLTILFGNFLKKVKLIDEIFISKANKLIFYILLPLLLFYKIAKSDFNKTFDIKYILIMYFSFIILIILAIPILKLLKTDKSDIGTFLMNSFRGNYAYVGLPVSYFSFGDKGLVIASIYMAFIVPVVNLLSVIVLSFSSEKSSSKKEVFYQIVFNPLAIACIFGILFSLLKIDIPIAIDRFLSINSSATLPLALLSIGATINLQKLGNSFKLSLINTLFKLIILPVLGFIILFLTKTPISLHAKIMIILLAAPAATVNFVLAKEMGGNENLSASTIILSTILSFFSYLVYLTLLQ